MKRFFACTVVLTLATICLGADSQSTKSSVGLARSDFRLIREVRFQGRDLFDLAIEAGMYKRKGTEYLPGAERGAVSVSGRTWHGSNGVGLVAYDIHMKQYAIYYLQDMAVPGHHLEIVYSDNDFIFFSYGSHRDIPTVKPALEVYSVTHNGFARIEAVATRGGRFGRSDLDALDAKRPDDIGPSIGWDHRHYAEKNWVSLSDAGMFRPERVTLQNDVFTLWYHTSWDIDEFVTALHFKKNDLQQKFENMTSNKADAGDGK